MFDDTSADQQGPAMPGQQYTGADFLQAPVTNMAFQYGTNMASQGKEYVEKNVRSFTQFSSYSTMYMYLQSIVKNNCWQPVIGSYMHFDIC